MFSTEERNETYTDVYTRWICPLITKLTLGLFEWCLRMCMYSGGTSDGDG